jgi:hypothetical protein
LPGEEEAPDLEVEAAEPVLHDPFLAALGGDAPAAAVFEVSALRHGPFGDRVLSCLRGPMREGMDDLRTETGIDVIEDVDRVALFADGDAFGMLVSGHFPEGGWEKILDDVFPPPRRWGDAWIYDEGGEAVGLWRGQVLVAGESAQHVRDRIDLLEGRGQAARAPLSTEDSYGELYGALTAEMIVEMLGAVDPDMARRAGELLLGGRFNLSASGDVGMVSVLEATSADAADDLARLLAGAMSLARTTARRQGDGHLSDLLELARVVPPPRGDTRFTLELALPESYLDGVLSSWCERMASSFPDEPLDETELPSTALPGGGP